MGIADGLDDERGTWLISHILRGFAYDFLTKGPVGKVNTVQGVVKMPQPNFAQARLV